MPSRNPTQLSAFINKFVDAVTIRPFLNDLRRMKEDAAIFRALPRHEADTRTTEAA